MAVQTIGTLKNWFKTGLKPLQQQFWDWLDSYRHKSVKITMSDLDNALQNAINAGGTATNIIVLPIGTASYVVPANTLISAIVFDDNTNPAGVTIGTSLGNNDIATDDVTGGQLVTSLFFRKKINTTLYFGGITAGTTITLYKA